MPLLVVKKQPFSQKRKKPIIIVSKKILKKASQRNLLKRRMRAILTPLFKKREHGQGYKIILGRDVLKTPFKELKKTTEESFKK
ncbi:MAG: ribonuclease P protein component [Patescibacteria group bacterium]